MSLGPVPIATTYDTSNAPGCGPIEEGGCLGVSFGDMLPIITDTTGNVYDYDGDVVGGNPMQDGPSPISMPTTI